MIVDLSERSLEEAFLNLKTEEEVKLFLRDLCTPSEEKALRERWKVCQILEHNDKSYHAIHEATGVSITTIGRVSRFLKQEAYGGYRLILDRLKKVHLLK